MSRSLAIATAAAALLAPSTLPAQSSDRDAVLATIQRMFDGMAAGDTAMMASTLEDGARLVQTFSLDGVPATRELMMSEFLVRVADHEGEALIERFWDPEVRIHDNLATVWVSYNFYLGAQLDHCGEDAFQLARTPEGWWVIAIADTQRRECTERP
jgi:hypothetical protein